MFPLGDGCGRGTRLDDVRLLTLLHKPTHFQFALPIKDGSCESVQEALKLSKHP